MTTQRLGRIGSSVRPLWSPLMPITNAMNRFIGLKFKESIGRGRGNLYGKIHRRNTVRVGATTRSIHKGVRGFEKGLLIVKGLPRRLRYSTTFASRSANPFMSATSNHWKNFKRKSSMWAPCTMANSKLESNSSSSLRVSGAWPFLPRIGVRAAPKPSAAPPLPLSRRSRPRCRSNRWPQASPPFQSLE